MIGGFILFGVMLHIFSIKILLQERGINMNKYTDNEIEKMWDELADVPFNEDSEGKLILSVDWKDFTKGTDRDEIWHFFDENHSKGVAWLLYEYTSDNLTKDEGVVELWDKIEEILVDEGVRYDFGDMSGNRDALIDFYTDFCGQEIPTEFKYDGTPEDFINKFCECAENYNVDEEVEVWIDHRGKGGCPSAVCDLLTDCEEAKSTLMRIARRFKNALIGEEVVKDSYKLLGIVGTVKELKKILEELPEDVPISAAGGDCYVIIKNNDDGTCEYVVLDEKDYSEEWNL